MKSGDRQLLMHKIWVSVSKLQKLSHLILKNFNFSSSPRSIKSRSSGLCQKTVSFSASRQHQDYSRFSCITSGNRTGIDGQGLKDVKINSCSFFTSYLITNFLAQQVKCNNIIHCSIISKFLAVKLKRY